MCLLGLYSKEPSALAVHQEAWSTWAILFDAIPQPRHSSLGLHLTLGGGFNTSQISQKPLENHQNP